MSQRIVIFCDVHQSRDEDVPGKSYDLALRPNAGTFTFATVDLCDACAKPLLDVFGEMVEVGREFDGNPLELRPGKAKSSPVGRPAKSTTCPACGHAFGSRGSLRAHARDVHGKTVAELEQGDAADVHTCPHCGGVYERSQGLAAHVRAAHPTEFADAKARAGD